MPTQMKNAKLFLLFFPILSSCQTLPPSLQEIADFAGRPASEDPCIANGDGTCFRSGDIVQTTNMICGEAIDFDNIQTHLEKMERFYYECKNFKRCD